MKTTIITIIAALLLPLGAMAMTEGFEPVLTEIEKNNSTLSALREEAGANKLNNLTGLTLANPEVEFNYLWGSPSEIGSRKDFSVTQTFDFATLLGYKRNVAERQNNLIDLQLKQERLNILLEAKKNLIDLVYYNGLRKELTTRLNYAQYLADAYNERLEKGDANILEVNKVKLNLTSTLNELRRVEIERESLLNNLKRLNGGIPLNFEENNYTREVLPPDFDSWYQVAEVKNPVLQYVRGETDLANEEVKLSKSKGLPSFSTGYAMEKTLGQNYQGISFGISIPLWENKNRVKQAKASVRASQSKEKDVRLQFYTSLSGLYNKTRGLQKVALDYSASLASLNNSALLQKALNSGEISLLDYIVENGLYYDAVNQALQAQRDYEISLAELQVFEL